MKGRNQHAGGWTRKEDEVLFALYETHGSRAVMEKTGRTILACQNRARHYGLQVNRKLAAAHRAKAG
jgi:hypothetical protein